jgi:hypothetical protein
MGRASEWHVVEPTRGGLANSVLIQHTTTGVKANVGISSRDADVLDEQELINRIQRAIDNATPG